MALGAVIFDFDGTILDTETPEFTVWSDTYRQYGLELSLADWGRGVGTWGGFDPWFDLEQKLGRPLEQEALSVQHRARVHAAIGRSELLPGVRDLLELARAAHLKLGIASSSGRDWVQSWAQKFEVLPYFAALATKEDVFRVKPDPALYRVACEKLKVNPSDALALEDSVNGARAALSAGLRCVVIPNPVTRDLEFPAGVERLESLRGVTLETLEALL